MKLVLNVKSEYFDQMKSGDKTEEYRLYNAYWIKRIVGKRFDCVEIALGYPKRGDTDRRMIRPWKGYKIKMIIHKHFGDLPVKVFAIRVNEEKENRIQNHTRRT